MSTVRIPITVHIPSQASDGVNVFHFRGATGVVDAQVLSTALGQLKTFYTAISSLYQNDVVLTTPDFATTVGDAPVYVPVSDSDKWSVQGTGGSFSAPRVLQIVCDWISTSPSRSGRGRTFIGPLCGDALDSDGTPQATRLSALRGAAEGLVAAGQATTARATIGVYSTTHKLQRDAVRSSVRDRFAVLRSRRS